MMGLEIEGGAVVGPYIICLELAVAILSVSSTSSILGSHPWQPSQARLPSAPAVMQRLAKSTARGHMMPDVL